MESIQKGILLPAPKHGRYVHFDLKQGAERESIIACLQVLAHRTDGEKLLVGLGATLFQTLGHSITGLTIFPDNLRWRDELSDEPVALWCWLRGSDRGDLMHEAYALEQLLSPAFAVRYVVDGFTHQSGHDLTGYEDGIENPKGQAAVEAAFVSEGDGLRGSSFVAVQQWQHQWAEFHRMSQSEQDNAMGRERISNDELEDAPITAHVKRTAQEDLEPEAFILRRSMPWLDGQKSGLMFVGFGNSFAAFEAQWRRMLGRDDGMIDDLFRFSQPLSNDYYWCPPMLHGVLDLTVLGTPFNEEKSHER